MTTKRYLCIDVGFTHTRFAKAYDGALENYRRARTLRDPEMNRANGDSRRRAWVTALAREVRQELAADPSIDLVALCFPGVVSACGSIWRENIIWGVTADDLNSDQLEQAFGRPVRITNDLTAAAIRYGYDPTIEANRFVMTLSVSSGIGAKLFDRLTGEVLLEPRGRNGEVGLALVNPSPDARANALGLRGILGNYSSGFSFARLVQETAMESPAAYADSKLYCHLGDGISSLDRFSINAAAITCLAEGDAFCLELLQTSVEPIARVVQTLILFSAPEVLVVTGGFADSVGDLYIQMLRDQVKSYLPMLYDADEIDRIIRPGYRDDCDNLFGLAAWAGRMPAASGPRMEP